MCIRTDYILYYIFCKTLYIERRSVWVVRYISSGGQIFHCLCWKNLEVMELKPDEFQFVQSGGMGTIEMLYTTWTVWLNSRYIIIANKYCGTTICLLNPSIRHSNCNNTALRSVKRFMFVPSLFECTYNVLCHWNFGTIHRHHVLWTRRNKNVPKLGLYVKRSHYPFAALTPIAPLACPFRISYRRPIKETNGLGALKTPPRRPRCVAAEIKRDCR